MQKSYSKILLFFFAFVLVSPTMVQANQGLRSILKVISAAGGMTTVVHFICEYNEAKDSLQMVKTSLAELEQLDIPQREINTIRVGPTQNTDQQMLSQLLIQSSAGKTQTIKIPVKSIQSKNLSQLKPISNQALLKDYTIGSTATIASFSPEKRGWGTLIQQYLFSKTGITIIVIILLSLWLRS